MSHNNTWHTSYHALGSRLSNLTAVCTYVSVNFMCLILPYNTIGLGVNDLSTFNVFYGEDAALILNIDPLRSAVRIV